MPAMVLEQIHVKLMEILAAGLAPHYPSLTVERNRTRATQSFPAVILREGPYTTDEGGEESTGFARYTTTPEIELWVQTTTDAELGPAINLLLGRVVKAVKADRCLGGLAIDLREISAEVIESHNQNQQPRIARSLSLEIDFWTNETDPHEIGPGI